MVESASRLFRVMADPIRLRILHLLRAGELCVGDLVTVLDVPQPTASRHLGVPQAGRTDLGEEEQLLDVLCARSRAHAASAQAAERLDADGAGQVKDAKRAGDHPPKWRLLSAVITSMRANLMTSRVHSDDSAESLRGHRVRFVGQCLCR